MIRPLAAYALAAALFGGIPLLVAFALGWRPPRLTPRRAFILAVAAWASLFAYVTADEKPGPGPGPAPVVRVNPVIRFIRCADGLARFYNARAAADRPKYDAELEWLQANGTTNAWIECEDSIFKLNDTISLKFSFEQSFAQQRVFSRGHVYQDSVYQNGQGYVAHSYSNSWTSFGQVAQNRYDKGPFSASLNLAKDGVSSITNAAGQVLSVKGPVAPGMRLPLCFFWTSPGLAKGNSCRLYWFNAKHADGSPVCDLIPVRKGSTGYLYDRVSGRLYGNAGTGSFILGPDKN